MVQKKSTAAPDEPNKDESVELSKYDQGLVDIFSNQLGGGVTIMGGPENGKKGFTLELEPRDGRKAIPHDVCHCTIARGVRRYDDVAGSLVYRTRAYIAEWLDSAHTRVKIRKYLHSGRSVAQLLDVEGAKLSDLDGTKVHFRVPSASTAVGAGRSYPNKGKGTPQTPEQIAKKTGSADVEGVKKTPKPQQRAMRNSVDYSK